jgi:hypothetical protein
VVAGVDVPSPSDCGSTTTDLNHAVTIVGFGNKGYEDGGYWCV